MQIAREIFLSTLDVMKKILCLAEFKLGKTSADYKYMKKEIMNVTYLHLNDLFMKFLKEGLLAKCECKAMLRQGYSPCKICSGSGFKNTDKTGKD